MTADRKTGAAGATVLSSLNNGLLQAFAEDERVLLLGEDVLDPYGGAFKVTRGLSSAYPDRVWTSPISEAGIVGAAAGLAMRGFHPVVEIMFGDFLTLAADQIVNHLAKFAWMYSGNKPAGEQVHLPLVIRTPMGGRRGYGPTHSQTIEKLFLGVPGLRVLAPVCLDLDSSSSPGGLLKRAILNEEHPTLFIENKLQYLQPLLDTSALVDWEITRYETGNSRYPSYTLRLRGSPEADLTVTAYGYMAELARQAVLELAYEHEVFCELVIPTQLSPFDHQPLVASLHRTRRLLAVEEGGLTLGWGAEILAKAVENLPVALQAAGRVAGRDLPVPASLPLENAALPGLAAIVARGLELAKSR